MISTLGRTPSWNSAAVMSCLDLIVTSDTSIAHLAGALGRPVWVALKHVPDWRWMLDRGDSPWYPTMKLYRQNKRDAWDEVFAAIAQDVARLSQSSEAPSLELIPVSIGEFVRQNHDTRDQSPTDQR